MYHLFNDIGTLIPKVITGISNEGLHLLIIVSEIFSGSGSLLLVIVVVSIELLS